MVRSRFFLGSALVSLGALCWASCDGENGEIDAGDEADADAVDADAVDGDAADAPVEPCPPEMVLIDDGERPFCIDRYEHPGVEGDVPTIGVPWYQARDLCADLSKELCLQDQWVRACRGTLAQECSGTIGASGRRPGCVSDFGVHDMAGNVAEWTASPGGSVSWWVQGGSGESGAVGCEIRAEVDAEDRAVDLGLRCCRRPR